MPTRPITPSAGPSPKSRSGSNAVFDRHWGRIQVTWLTACYWIRVGWDVALSIVLALAGIFFVGDVVAWILWAASLLTIVRPIYRGMTLFRSHHHKSISVEFSSIRLDGPLLDWS